MELALLVGDGKESRKRSSTGREFCLIDGEGDQEGGRGGRVNHPSLRLELKLSGPNELETGNSYNTRSLSQLASTNRCGLNVNVTTETMNDRYKEKETGPTVSTSRSTTGERVSWRCSDEEEGICEGGTRKKLRLSKEQSCYLEESFKENTTLNPKQKLVIAKRLNLRSRQVEVWFQNRRARTKLKQTEVEYEYLKKWREYLTEENRRLHKEIEELKALKSPYPHLYSHSHATTLTMCPSCDPRASENADQRKDGFGIPARLRENYLKHDNLWEY